MCASINKEGFNNSSLFFVNYYNLPNIETINNIYTTSTIKTTSTYE